MAGSFALASHDTRRQFPDIWIVAAGMALLLFSSDSRRIYTVSLAYSSQSIANGTNMYIAAGVLLLLAIIYYRKPTFSLLRMKWVTALAAISCSIMHVVMYVVGVSYDLGFALLLGLYCLSTLGSTLLCIIWVRVLEPHRTNLWFLTLGLALGCLGIMEIVATCILPSVSGVLISLSPIASGIILMTRLKKESSPLDETTSIADNSKPVFGVMTALLFGLIIILLSNLTYTIEAASGKADASAISMQLSYAFGVLLAGATLTVVASLPRSRFYLPFLVLLIPGCFGISHMLINSGQGVVAFLALIPLGLMKRLVLILPLLFLTGSKQNTTAKACILGSVYLLGGVIGAAPLIRNLASPTSVAYSLTVVVAFTVLLALSFCLVMLSVGQREDTTSFIKPQATAQNMNDLKLQAVEAIASQYGLTPRETEILNLLGSGWKAQSISEKLTLSHTTVKNHMGRIYRKLEVHSQQEIMIMLEERTSMVLSSE